MIAIVAVLTSLLLPVATKAREGGKRANCVANMRQLSAAYLLMVGERNGELVQASGGGKTWYTEMESYVPLKTGNDFLRVSCPSALANLKSLGYQYTVTRPSYGLNAYIGPEGVTPRIANLIKPGATVLLGDSSIVGNKDGMNMGIAANGNNLITSYHRDKSAIAYFDGHTAHVDQAFVSLMKSTRNTEGSEGSIFWKGF